MKGIVVRGIVVITRRLKEQVLLEPSPYTASMGGVINGYGTFYEGRKEVVWEGLTIGVKSSDRNRWNYMIVWNDGSKWYFD